MATISIDTFLDSGTARTAGEAQTMNGAVLTIRTDTRVHADAPAAMTGSIGSMAISATSGGGIFIDGTKVRWLPFDSGTGNVPVIGTDITQGGVVSSYLLGVYADLVSAPVTPGSAMPTSGFLKFREVDGAFAAGVLSGIGASAIGQDKVGQIEVVQRQAAANTIPRLGYFRTRGDWFELDLTTGVAGQILQVPTNGGGVGTNVPAVQIETGVGTGLYEIYPAIISTYFIPTNLGTDIRCKFVETIGNGQLRIGNNGTSDVGYVPPAGCKVRIPNIFGRQATLAAGDANNLVPHATIATRPDFVTTAAGEIDIENFLADQYLIFASPYKVKLINTAVFDTINTSNNAAPCDIDNLAMGGYLAASQLTLTSNFLGGTIKNSKFFRCGAASNGHVCSIITSADYVISNCHFGVIQYARSTGRAISTSQCLNLEFNDIYQYNSYTQHSTSFNIKHNGVDHCDRLVGETNTTTGMYAVSVLTSSDNIVVDGLTFGLKGAILNVNTYLAPFYSINSSNIIFKNAGTITNPLSCNSSAAPQYGAHDAGVNSNVKFQRIYLERTRTSAFLTVNTSKNILFEHVYGTIGSLQTLSLNTIVRGVRAASNSVSGAASVYGSHFFDMFTSDTEGRLWLAFNEDTEFSSAYISKTLGIGAGFTSGGQVSMPNIDDQIIIEMSYFAIGHTGFADITPTLTGGNTGNFNYEYDIDTGNGQSNSYKIINGTNLSAETIDPSIGFKLKFRITCTVANSTNALTYIRLDTVSSLAAQTNNLYPLITVNLKLTGFKLGTRIQLFNIDTDEEIYNDIPTTTTLNFPAVYSEDNEIRIRAMYTDSSSAMMFIEFNEIATANGFTRSIDQIDDVIYAQNGVDGAGITTITIDDSALLVNVDTGQLSWADIYAYETHQLSTTEGIRDETRFIEAKDTANYLFENFKIKNVSSPTEPLVIVNGWGRDSETNKTLDIIDPTGGTIFSNPDLVIAYATSSSTGGGATASEIWSYSSRKLTSVGNSEVAQEVWDTDSSTVQVGSFGETVKKIQVLCKNIFSLSA